jgi:hypothetical protein
VTVNGSGGQPGASVLGAYPGGARENSSAARPRRFGILHTAESLGPEDVRGDDGLMSSYEASEEPTDAD